METGELYKILLSNSRQLEINLEKWQPDWAIPQ